MKGKRFNHHRTSARLSATQATVHQRIRTVLIIVMSRLTRGCLLPAIDGSDVCLSRNLPNRKIDFFFSFLFLLISFSRKNCLQK